MHLQLINILSLRKQKGENSPVKKPEIGNLECTLEHLKTLLKSISKFGALGIFHTISQ